MILFFTCMGYPIESFYIWFFCSWMWFAAPPPRRLIFYSYFILMWFSSVIHFTHDSLILTSFGFHMNHLTHESFYTLLWFSHVIPPMIHVTCDSFHFACQFPMIHLTCDSSLHMIHFTYDSLILMRFSHHDSFYVWFFDSHMNHLTHDSFYTFFLFSRDFPPWFMLHLILFFLHVSFPVIHFTWFIFHTTPPWYILPMIL